MKEKYLIVVIVLLSIGFAAVTTILTINGSIKIGANGDQFGKDVIFTDASTEEGGSANISQDGKTITYVSKILSLVGEKTVLNFEISNKSTQFDAIAYIECTTEIEPLLSKFIEVKPSATSYYITSQGKETGYVTSTLRRAIISDEDPTSAQITCTLNVEAVDKGTVPEGEYVPDPAPEVEEKVLVSGDINTIGAEVSILDEHFFVIAIDDEKLTLLSKYLIVFGDFKFKQIPGFSSEYTDYFAGSRYWSADEGGVCESYPPYFTTNYNEYGLCDDINVTNPDEELIAPFAAYYYAKQFSDDITGRLLTVKEILDLVPNAEYKDDSITGTYSNIINGKYNDNRSSYLSYWLAAASGDSTLWTVEGRSGRLKTSTNTRRVYGIRPVIEIPKSLIVVENPDSDGTQN